MSAEPILSIRPAAGPVEEPTATEAAGRKARVRAEAQEVQRDDAVEQSVSPPPTIEDPRARPEGAGDRKGRQAAAIAAAGGPLGMDTATAAAMCGMGRSTWFRAAAAKKTPAPVRIVGKVLYRVEDLRLWMALGCPSRKEFEARRAATNGRR